MNIQDEFNKNDYIFLPEWQKNKTTQEIACSIGTLFSPSKFSGYEAIKDIQQLVPKERNKDLKNHYAGHFGLDEYPLHSDLAHWTSPPRTIMLRCVKGSNNVTTNILPIKSIINELLELSISRAVVKPRSNKKNPHISLLPLIFKRDNTIAFRWDSLFLEPANTPAIKIRDFLIHTDLSVLYVKFHLNNPGDTLILNNWRTLHGRSTVPKSAINRIIDRVYLN